MVNMTYFRHTLGTLSDDEVLPVLVDKVSQGIESSTIRRDEKKGESRKMRVNGSDSPQTKKKSRSTFGDVDLKGNPVS